MGYRNFLAYFYLPNHFQKFDAEVSKHPVYKGSPHKVKPLHHIVEKTERGSPTTLLFKITYFERSGNDQDGFDSSETPVVMVLLGQQLLTERVESDELAGQESSLLEPLSYQHDLTDELKVRYNHSAGPAQWTWYKCLCYLTLNRVINKGCNSI